MLGIALAALIYSFVGCHVDWDTNDIGFDPKINWTNET